jgi:hypothetical protein
MDISNSSRRADYTRGFAVRAMAVIGSGVGHAFDYGCVLP